MSITEQLGGLQEITCGSIEAGDKVTYTFNGERVMDDVMDAEQFLVGLPVVVAKELFDLTVYRKLSVAKQGDIDHQSQEVENCGCACPCVGTYDGEDIRETPYISQDSEERKNAPMFRGLLGYFPAALFEVARHSQDSEKKHNPDAKDGPTWARYKSNDHADCIVRHLIDAGEPGDEDRILHLRALAWRALALLQEECEAAGYRPGVSSRFE